MSPRRQGGRESGVHLCIYLFIIFSLNKIYSRHPKAQICFPFGEALNLSSIVTLSICIGLCSRDTEHHSSCLQTGLLTTSLDKDEQAMITAPITTN